MHIALEGNAVYLGIGLEIEHFQVMSNMFNYDQHVTCALFDTSCGNVEFVVRRVSS
jgi:hypothetical protein